MGFLFSGTHCIRQWLILNHLKRKKKRRSWVRFPRHGEGVSWYMTELSENKQGEAKKQTKHYIFPRFKHPPSPRVCACSSPNEKLAFCIDDWCNKISDMTHISCIYITRLFWCSQAYIHYTRSLFTYNEGSYYARGGGGGRALPLLKVV